jgi:hypothetical protein
MSNIEEYINKLKLYRERKDKTLPPCSYMYFNKICNNDACNVKSYTYFTNFRCKSHITVPFNNKELEKTITDIFNGELNELQNNNYISPPTSPLSYSPIISPLSDNSIDDLSMSFSSMSLDNKKQRLN